MGFMYTRTGKSRIMINDLADYILMVYVVLMDGQGYVICRWPGLKPTVVLAFMIRQISMPNHFVISLSMWKHMSSIKRFSVDTFLPAYLSEST